MQLAQRHVARTARQIEEGAKRLAPVRKPNENHRPGGRLRASIGTKEFTHGFVASARVGSKVRYALVVHQGADPHDILPRHKKVLAFRWNNAPDHLVVKHGKWKGFVFLKKVKHPGMKGISYLTTPLHIAGLRNGFRVRNVVYRG